MQLSGISVCYIETANPNPNRFFVLWTTQAVNTPTSTLQHLTFYSEWSSMYLQSSTVLHSD